MSLGKKLKDLAVKILFIPINAFNLDLELLEKKYFPYIIWLIGILFSLYAHSTSKNKIQSLLNSNINLIPALIESNLNFFRILLLIIPLVIFLIFGYIGLIIHYNDQSKNRKKSF